MHEGVWAFGLGDTAALNSVVDTFMEHIGHEAVMVAIGEALHGGEEILQLRNAVARRLLEAHGFSAVVLESCMVRGRILNRYVAGLESRDWDSVGADGFSHAAGKLEANHELVEFMRQLNAGRAESDEEGTAAAVSIYGFDMPGWDAGPSSPRRALEIALAALESIDAESARELRMRMDAALGEDERWEQVMPWHDPVTAAPLLAMVDGARGVLAEIAMALETRRPDLELSMGAREAADALHYACLAHRQLEFFRALGTSRDYSASLAVRDAIMAQNLLHIGRSEAGRGRVLVFAHNAHVQKGKVHVDFGTQTCSWWPAGAHVSLALEHAYVVLGTAVGESEANGIAAPETGTVEARLIEHATGDTPRVVGVLADRPGRLAAGAGADEAPLASRTGSTTNRSYIPIGPRWWQEFDALALIDFVSACKKRA